MPNLVTGQLLGLDIGQTLEVTDCFPFPNVEDGDEVRISGAAVDSLGAWGSSHRSSRGLRGA